MAQTCILTTREAEIEKIMVQGQFWQKLLRFTFQQNKPSVVAHTCHPSLEGIGLRITIQRQL
jgi:hypothetical protein